LREEVSAMELSGLKVKVEIKVHWWFKAFMFCILLMMETKLMNPVKGDKLIDQASRRGLKYRIDGVEWEGVKGLGVKGEGEKDAKPIL